MAEVQSSRPATRGRGSSRGRGGYSSRTGGRHTSKNTNGTTADNAPQTSIDEQGELGQLKRKYQSELPLLKDVFPDWSDEDLVFAIQESNGDVQSTIEKIAEGNVSQFTDVKKKPREKSRAKAATEAFFLAPGDAETKNPTARASRGRGGTESGRGGRGRGSDRGRGGARGGRGGSGTATTGSRSAAPEPASTNVETAAGSWDSQTETPEVSSGWAGTTGDQTAATDDQWAGNTSSEGINAPAKEESKSSLIPQGATKSWASMLAKPKVAPTSQKTLQNPANALQPDVPATSELPSTNAGPIADQWDSQQRQASWNDDSQLGAHVDDSFGAASTNTNDLTPPKDPLTEDNVENLPDISGPAPTETAASTRGDERSAIGGSTSAYAGSQQAPIGRPSLGGFATSAQKAANVSGRSLSYQRLKEQQDAVVMPGNHAVDRAAVQFGQMGLGTGDGSGPQDVDDDREDAETRAQPPQQSPSQPRAALPPAPRSYQLPTDHAPQENVPTPRQAPGLPMPGNQQGGMGGQASNPPGAPGLGQPGADGHSYGSYGRYGGNAYGQDQGAPPQKEYDPFSTQLNPTSHNEQRNAYGGASQAPGQSSHPTNSYSGGYSQAPGDYSSQYPVEASQGNYSNYYGGGYGQPPTASSMAENVPPQRSGNGFSTQDARYSSNPSHASQYNEGRASGNNTPNPTLHGQHGHQSHHGPTHGQSGYGSSQHYGGGGYYGGGYGGSGYGGYGGQGYNQYGGYGQGGYGSGSGYGSKGGMYGGGSSSSHAYNSHNYGAPGGNSSYDHQTSSSPATTGAFGSSSGPTGGRESMSSNPLGEYGTGRSGSTQPSNATPSGGFGGMNENPGSSYGGARSTSGFGSHASTSQGYGHNQSYGAGTEGGAGGNSDPLKSIHDSKTGSAGAGGRPGSAFNSASHGAYGPQGGHGGFGGQGQYGGSSGYGSSAGGGGIGSLGSHGAPGAGGAGGQYGQGAFGGAYGSRGGGWGSQYGSGAGNYGH